MATARLTDPATSHMAAASITTEAITRTQAAILEILETPKTDEQILDRYRHRVKQGIWSPVSESGLRSRRAELVARGLVEPKGIGKTEFGRPCTIWGLTDGR